MLEIHLVENGMSIPVDCSTTRTRLHQNHDGDISRDNPETPAEIRGECATVIDS
jgi:hypothetical protein